MSGFFVRVIITRLKLVFSASFLCALLIFPLALLFVAAVFSNPKNGKINVGLMYKDAPISNRIVDSFQTQLDKNIQIIIFEDQEKMLDEVKKTNLECAYVIKDSIEEGNFQEAIELYKSPSTMSAEPISLVLASGIIGTMSGDLGYEVLSKYFDEEKKNEIVNFINTKSQGYISEGSLMKINYLNMGKEISAIPSNNFKNIYFGLTALFALLLTFLAAMSLVDEKHSAVYKLIKASQINIFQYFLANMLGIFMIILLFFLTTAFSINLLDKNIAVNYFSLIPLIFAYTLTIVCFSTVIVCYLKSDTVLPAITTFVFIGSALFGNVFFNVSEFFTGLSAVQYFFFTSYFTTALSKTLPLFEISVLFLLSVVFLLLIYYNTKKIR